MHNVKGRLVSVGCGEKIPWDTFDQHGEFCPRGTGWCFRTLQMLIRSAGCLLFFLPRIVFESCCYFVPHQHEAASNSYPRIALRSTYKGVHLSHDRKEDASYCISQFSRGRSSRSSSGYTKQRITPDHCQISSIGTQIFTTWWRLFQTPRSPLRQHRSLRCVNNHRPLDWSGSADATPAAAGGDHHCVSSLWAGT